MWRSGKAGNRNQMSWYPVLCLSHRNILLLWLRSAWVQFVICVLTLELKMCMYEIQFASRRGGQCHTTHPAKCLTGSVQYSLIYLHSHWFCFLCMNMEQILITSSINYTWAWKGSCTDMWPEFWPWSYHKVPKKQGNGYHCFRCLQHIPNWILPQITAFLTYHPMIFLHLDKSKHNILRHNMKLWKLPPQPYSILLLLFQEWNKLKWICS